MRDRFVKLSPEAGIDVHFGTFHSIYYKILKAYGNCDLSIASDNVKRAAALAVTDEDQREDFLNAVSAHKSGRDLSELFPGEQERERFVANEKLFNEIMAQKKLMDYDDILLKCRDLLKGNGSVQKLVSERFSHILVDEFQDINAIQYEILKLLLSDKEKGNLYVVGDEKQSIYGFRGSKPGIFDEFLADFPNARKYRLNVNYRNHEKILAAASKVVRDKEFTLAANQKNEGGIYIKSFEKKEEEHAAFLEDLDRALNEGMRTAVLARTNKDIAGLMELCGNVITAHGGKLPENKDHKEMIELYDAFISYLSFIETKGRGDLIRWLALRDPNIPRSIFPEERVDLFKVLERLSGTPIGDRIKKLEKELSLSQKLSAPALMTYLRTAVLKEADIKDSLREEIGIIEASSINVRTKDNLKAFLFERREAIIKASSVKRNKASENPAFLTFHASKGLEYDAVFIVDVVEGKIPRRSRFTDRDQEEERRLFYVGMTRARDELNIYTLKKEGALNMTPSRFLKDIM